MKKTISLLTLVSALTATASFASTTYDCTYVAGDDTGPITLTVSKAKAKIVAVYDENQPALVGDGTVAADYKPQAANENFVEYTGFGDFLSSDYGDVEALVEKNLVAGESKGDLKLRARAEGYFSALYTCTKN